jgi:hypothetical protein
MNWFMLHQSVVFRYFTTISGKCFTSDLDWLTPYGGAPDLWISVLSMWTDYHSGEISSTDSEHDPPYYLFYGEAFENNV